MPWVIEENRFESWIFGSKKDCEQWIEFSERAEDYMPVKVEIKEVRREKKT